MKIRGKPYNAPFRVRLELRPEGAVLVGRDDGRRVEVHPREIRMYSLAEATDYEKQALEEYGFRWLILD